MFEAPRKAGGLGNCNPIVHWTLEDCFDYIAHHKILHHPLHAKGYPSIGDAKDTIPIPEDGSVRFNSDTFQFEGEGNKNEWLGYGLERKGRFVGLANKDGSTKTECGIHVDGAGDVEKTFERDLWNTVSTVQSLESNKAASEFNNGLMVVYAPWCQFCKGMETELTTLSVNKPDLKIAKFRGDLDRDFSI